MRKKTARQALATNLNRLMASDPNLDTGAKIAAKTKGRVSQRSVSNMTRLDDPDTNAPLLDSVDAVAEAYGLEAWQLLLNAEAVAEQWLDAVTRLTAKPIRKLDPPYVPLPSDQFPKGRKESKPKSKPWKKPKE